MNIIEVITIIIIDLAEVKKGNKCSSTDVITIDTYPLPLKSFKSGNIGKLYSYCYIQY